MDELHITFRSNKPAKLRTKVLAYALIGMIACPAPLLADIIVDPTANVGFQPDVYQNNGVDIVNITTPSAGGISVNQFEQYNVDENGVVINNATTSGTSSLAGQTAANPNLGSRAANVIVNEVTGSTPSNLNGTTEIFGQSADVIIANPQGVTCDGCDFINTDRATLTTGSINTNNDQLAIEVRQGEVAIEGQGLDSQTTNVDLVGRTVRVEGDIKAGNELGIAAGSQDYQYSQRKAANGKLRDHLTAVPQTSNNPATSIDASVYGAMNAGSIEIISTDQGAGVKTHGYMSATADDLFLQSAGDIETRGIEARNDITVKTPNDFTQLGDSAAGNAINIDARNVTVTEDRIVEAGSALSINASESITHTGIIRANENIDLNAGDNITLGSQITTQDDFSATARNQVTLENSAVYANNIGFDADTLELQSALLAAAGELDLELQHLVLSGDSQIHHQGELTLDLQSVHNESTLYADQLTLNVINGLYNGPDAAVAGQAVVLNVGEDIVNEGAIQATTILDLNARHIDNFVDAVISANTVNVTAVSLDNDGKVIATEQLAIDLDTHFTNSHEVDAATITIDAQSIENRAGGELIAQTLSLQAHTISNALEASIQANTLSQFITTQDFTNAGELLTNTDATLHIGHQLLNDGAIASVEGLSLNVQHSIVNRGIISANDELNITTQSLIVDGQAHNASDVEERMLTGITSMGDMHLNISVLDMLGYSTVGSNANATLIADTITVAEHAQLTALNLDIETLNGTISGALNARQQLTLDTLNQLVVAGTLQAADATITSETVSINQPGLVIANDLTLDANAINVAGTLHAAEQGAVDVATFTITDTGRFESLVTASLTVSDTFNNAGTVVANMLDIQAPQWQNTGTISATSLAITAHEVSQNDLLLIAEDLDIDADIATFGVASVTEVKGHANYHINQLYLNGGQDLQAATIEADSIVMAGGEVSMLLVKDHLAVTANTFDVAGLISSQGSFDMMGNTLDNNGVMQAAQLLLSLTERIDNQGTLGASQAVTLATQQLYNWGSIGSLGNVTMTVDQLHNHQAIIAQQTLDIAATTVENHGDIQASTIDLLSDTLSLQAGELVALHALQVNAGDVYNAGYLQALDLTLTADTFTNDAGIVALGNAVLTLGALVNDGGSILDPDQGRITATNLTLDATTIKNLNASLLVSDAFTITSDTLENTGALQGGMTTLTVDDIDNEGGFSASQQLVITASTVNNHAQGVIVSEGDMDLLLTTFNNAGRIVSRAALLVEGTQLSNQGLIVAEGASTLAATDTWINQGQIVVYDDLDITSTQPVINTSTVESVGDLRIDTANTALLNTGALISNGDLQLNVASLYNRGENARINANTLVTTLASELVNEGQIVTQQQLTLSTDTLNNTGLLDSDSVSLSALVLDNQGAINSNTLTVTTQTLDQQGHVYANQIDLTAAQLNNTGRVIARDTLNIATHVLDNDGVLGANTTLSINATTATNQGRILSVADLFISGDTFNNHEVVEAGVLAITTNAFNNAADATLHANALFADVDQLHNRGTVSAVQDLVVMGAVSNQGLIAAQRWHYQHAGTLDNQAGTIQVNDLQLTVDTLDNRDGLIRTRLANITTDHLTNNAASQLEGAVISLAVNHDWQHHGQIIGQAVAINTQGQWVNQGLVSGVTQLAVTADTVINTDRLLSEQQLTINAQAVGNVGRIASLQQLDVTAHELINDGAGVLEGAQQHLIVDHVFNQATASINSNNLVINSVSIYNTANIVAGDLSIKAQANVTNLDRIQADNVHITAQAFINDTGVIRIKDELNLAANTLSNDQGGVYADDLTVTLSGDETFEHDGEIVANVLQLTVANDMINTGLIAGNQLTIAATTLDNRQRLFSYQDLNIDSDTFINTGITEAKQQAQIVAHAINNNGTIKAAHLVLDTPQLTNQTQGFIHADSADFNAVSQLNNHGEIISAATLQLNQLNNQGGFLQAAQLDVTGDVVNNHNGQIVANRITINSDQLINDTADSQLYAVDALSIATTQQFTNAGYLGSNGIVQINTQQGAANTQTGEIAANNVAVETAAGISNQGAITSHSSLQLSADQGLFNTGLITGVEVDIAAHTIENNDGLINAQQQLEIIVHTLNNYDSRSAHERADLDDVRGIYADHLVLSVTDSFINAGQVVVANDLSLETMGDMNNAHGLVQANDLTIGVGGQLDNSAGTLLALDNLALNAHALLTDSASVISAEQNTTLAVGTTFTNAGELSAGDTLTVTSGGSVTNAHTGGLIAEQINVTTADTFLNQGLLGAHDNLIIQANNQVTNQGEIRAVVLDVSQNATSTNNLPLAFNNEGIIKVDRAQFAVDTLTNTQQALLETQQDLNLMVDTLQNQGELLAIQGGISVTATDIDNQGGLIKVATTIDLTSQTLNNSQGSIDGLGDVTIIAQTNNDQGEIFGAHTSLTTGDLDNTGWIVGRQQLSIDADTITNQENGVLASLIVDITGSALHNAGVITGNQTLEVTASDDITNQGIITGGTLSLTTQGDISNELGYIHATQAMTLGATSLHNDTALDDESQGIIAPTLQLNLTHDLNNQGLLVSSDSLTLDINTLNNNEGVLQAKDLYLTANNASNNEGALYAINNVTLTTNTFSDTENGALNAQTVDLNFNASTTYQGYLSAQTATIDVMGVYEHQGQLNVAQSVNITADTLNNSGRLNSVGDLTLSLTDTINNLATGVIQARDTATFTTDVLNNAGQIIVYKDQSNDISQHQLHIHASTGASTIINAQDARVVAGAITAEGLNTVNNEGTIKGLASLTLATDTLENAATGSLEGFISTITANALTNSGNINGAYTQITTNRLDNQVTGVINADHRLNLTINSTDDTVNQGSISAGDCGDTHCLNLTVVGQLINQGVIETGTHGVITANGIDNQGRMVSYGDLILNSQQGITHHEQATLEAANNLALTAVDDIHNDGIIKAGNTLQLNTEGVIYNTDRDADDALAAGLYGHNVTLSATDYQYDRSNATHQYGLIHAENIAAIAQQADFTLNDELAIEAATLLISTEGDFYNEGGAINPSDHLGVEATNIYNQANSRLYSGGTLSLTATNDLINHGEIIASGAAQLRAATITNHELIVASGDLSITATEQFVNDQAMVLGFTNVTINADHVHNHVGQIQAFNDLTIIADSLHNEALIANVTGGSFKLKNASQLRNRNQYSTSSAYDYSTSEITLSGVLTPNTQEIQAAAIQAGNDLKLYVKDTVNENSALLAGNDLTIIGDTFKNVAYEILVDYTYNVGYDFGTNGGKNHAARTSPDEPCGNPNDYYCGYDYVAHDILKTYVRDAPSLDVYSDWLYHPDGTAVDITSENRFYQQNAFYQYSAPSYNSWQVTGSRPGNSFFFRTSEKDVPDALRDSQGNRLIHKTIRFTAATSYVHHEHANWMFNADTGELALFDWSEHATPITRVITIANDASQIKRYTSDTESAAAADSLVQASGNIHIQQSQSVTNRGIIKGDDVKIIVQNVEEDHGQEEATNQVTASDVLSSEDDYRDDVANHHAANSQLDDYVDTTFDDTGEDTQDTFIQTPELTFNTAALVPVSDFRNERQGEDRTIAIDERTDDRQSIVNYVPQDIKNIDARNLRGSQLLGENLRAAESDKTQLSYDREFRTVANAVTQANAHVSDPIEVALATINGSVTDEQAAIPGADTSSNRADNSEAYEDTIAVTDNSVAQFTRPFTALHESPALGAFSRDKTIRGQRAPPQTSGIINGVSNPSTENSLPQQPAAVIKLTDYYNPHTTTNGDFLEYLNTTDTGLGLTVNYLAEAIGQATDPDIPFFADPFVEIQLLQQAALNEAGSAYFSQDVSTPQEQRQALYDNAIAFAQDNELTLGEALTPEQIASLDESILWYEAQEIDGQTQLVPVLYLSEADRVAAQHHAGTISGNNVALVSDTKVHNTGSINATENLGISAHDIINEQQIVNSSQGSALANGGNLSADNITLIATNDIKNIAGSIDAGTSLAMKAANDIVIQSASYTEEQKGSYFHQITTRHALANISSGGDMSINAGNNLDLIGTEVTAEGDLSLFAAGDMTIASVNDRDYSYEKWVKKKSFGRKKVTIKESNKETVRANVLAAGGNLSINAVQTEDGLMLTEAGGVNMMGVDITAQNNIAINGDEVTVVAAAYSDASRTIKKKKRFGGLIRSMKLDALSNLELHASEIEAGGGLSIISNSDLTIGASNLTSGDDLNLVANDDLLVSSLDSWVHEERRRSRTSFGNILSGELFSMRQSAEGSGTSTAVASYLNAGGNIRMDAGTATLLGSDTEATGSISATTDIGDITVLAAQQISESYSEEREIEVKLSSILDDPTDLVSINNGRLQFSLGEASYSESEQRTKEITHRGAALIAGRDIQLDSIGDLTIEGSHLIADAVRDEDGNLGVGEDGEGNVFLLAQGDVAIREAENILTEYQRTLTASGQASIVVQHQAVELANAVTALQDAKDKLKEAKEAHRKYQKELNKLEDQVAKLEQDLANNVPGVSQQDIDLLKYLIAESKQDEAFYIADIAMATTALGTKTNSLASTLVATGSSLATYGFNAGLQLDLEGQRQTNESTTTTSQASSIAAQHVYIQTGQYDENGELDTANTATTIQGSTVQANGTVAINTGDFSALASQDTYHSINHTESGSVGVNATFYGAASGGANVSVSLNRNSARTSGTIHNNTHVLASNIAVNTSGDANFAGANIDALGILQLNVGGDLSLESLQDIHSSSNHGIGLSGGFGLGGGDVATNNFGNVTHSTGMIGSNLSSVNAGFNNSSGRSFSTQTRLSSLTGSDVDIDVEGDTNIIGSLMAALDEEGNDNGQLSLSTRSLSFEDLKDYHYSSNRSTNVSGGVSVANSNHGREDTRTFADGTKETATDNNGQINFQHTSGVSQHLNTQSAQNARIPAAAQPLENGRNAALSAANPTLGTNNSASHSLTTAMATIGNGALTIGGEEIDEVSRLNRDATATALDLFEVERQQGNFQATLELDLLTSEGHDRIAENFARAGNTLDTFIDAIVSNSVGIVGGDGVTSIDIELQAREAAYLAIKQFVSDKENAQLLNALVSGDATPEARQAALNALSEELSIAMGMTPMEAKLLISSQLLGAKAAYSRDEQAQNTAFIVDDAHETTGDLVNSLGNEFSHHMDYLMLGGDAVSGLSPEGYAARDEHSDIWGDLIQDYANSQLERQFNVSLDQTNANYQNAARIVTSSIVQQNGNMFGALDRTLVDNRQLSSTELGIIKEHAAAFAAQQGITVQEAATRLARQRLRTVDVKWEAVFAARGQGATDVEAEHFFIAAATQEGVASEALEVSEAERNNWALNAELAFDPNAGLDIYAQNVLPAHQGALLRFHQDATSDHGRLLANMAFGSAFVNEDPEFIFRVHQFSPGVYLTMAQELGWDEYMANVALAAAARQESNGQTDRIPEQYDPESCYVGCDFTYRRPGFPGGSTRHIIDNQFITPEDAAFIARSASQNIPLDDHENYAAIVQHVLGSEGGESQLYGGVGGYVHLDPDYEGTSQHTVTYGRHAEYQSFGHDFSPEQTQAVVDEYSFDINPNQAWAYPEDIPLYHFVNAIYDFVGENVVPEGASYNAYADIRQQLLDDDYDGSFNLTAAYGQATQTYTENYQANQWFTSYSEQELSEMLYGDGPTSDAVTALLHGLVLNPAEQTFTNAFDSSIPGPLHYDAVDMVAGGAVETALGYGAYRWLGGFGSSSYIGETPYLFDVRTGMSGHDLAAEVLDGGNGQTLVGHGNHRPFNGFTSVPDGTTVILPRDDIELYNISGWVLETIDLEVFSNATDSQRRGMIDTQLDFLINHLGSNVVDITDSVDRGVVHENLSGIRVLQSGQYFPNYTISPPKKLPIFDNSISFDRDIKLDDWLEDNMGCVGVATCTIRLDR